LEVLPDEITGYTELKNSSAMLLGTNANSSKNTQLKEPPRIAELDVDAAIILEPFSSSTLPLFYVTTPCCNHIGKFSYASWYLAKISRASEPLLARTATVCVSVNRVNQRRYATEVVVLPT